MTKLYGVSCCHPCCQLRGRNGVSSSVSSLVMTGGGCRCCEWITVDELGLFDIGNNNWIKSNQLWYMDGGVVCYAMPCLIVIYDCVGTYNETIIMVGMSSSFLNSLSRPCPSVSPRIFTTLIFQVYTYVQLGDVVDCLK